VERFSSVPAELSVSPVSPPVESARSLRAQIRAHVERHLGPVKQVLCDPSADADAPPLPAIDVLHVASAVDRPVHTLVTVGMSDRPMDTGNARDAPQYLEVMMTLPKRWKLDATAQTDSAWNWPIRLLAAVARFPQVHQRRLGWGDIVPNGDPPRPYARNTAQRGPLLAPSLLVPKEFYQLDTDRRHIEFYSAIPVYREELELQREKGMQYLLAALIDHGINDLVDPKRRNVARKRFSLF
jgi:hypothetical protein